MIPPSLYLKVFTLGGFKSGESFGLRISFSLSKGIPSIFRVQRRELKGVFQRKAAWREGKKNPLSEG
jgi:hypothetical protein